MTNILNQAAMSPHVVTPEMFASRPVHPSTHGHLPDASVGAHHATVDHNSLAEHAVMPSLGLLDGLMHDDSVNDILVNGTKYIYVDRFGKLSDSGLCFNSNEEVLGIAERIMRAVNQFWVPERPIIDTRLPDGSRVNIVGPPIAIDGVSISIRKFPKRSVTLDDMVSQGNISPELGSFLKECVRMRMNIIISGGTSVGKTTMLNALSAAIPNDERVVTIEDSAELRMQQPHVVRLEMKPERAVPDKLIPEVNARDLVKNALRMRPDRIILGEARGPESFDVIQAMNTGHDGSITTLHANSPRDALTRIETMSMSALPNLTAKILRGQMASALNLVIQIERDKDGNRRISHVSEICGMEGETIVMQDLVVFGPGPLGKGGMEYRWSQGSPRTPELVEAAQIAGFMKKLR